jgi:hypothetical protein
MAQEFNEEVRCNQGLTVAKSETASRTFLSGSEIFSLQNEKLRFTLAPNGLFFHHVAGHNTAEIDAAKGEITLNGEGSPFVLSAERLNQISQAISGLLSEVAGLKLQVQVLDQRVRSLELGNP